MFVICTPRFRAAFNIPRLLLISLLRPLRRHLLGAGPQSEMPGHAAGPCHSWNLLALAMYSHDGPSIVPGWAGSGVVMRVWHI